MAREAELQLLSQAKEVGLAALAGALYNIEQNKSRTRRAWLVFFFCVYSVATKGCNVCVYLLFGHGGGRGGGAMFCRDGCT